MGDTKTLTEEIPMETPKESLFAHMLPSSILVFLKRHTLNGLSLSSLKEG
jgi:hypothetical protein